MSFMPLKGVSFEIKRIRMLMMANYIHRICCIKLFVTIKCGPGKTQLKVETVEVCH